ncbi:hypothetical protein ACFX11_036048 [Malus domestica]
MKKEKAITFHRTQNPKLLEKLNNSIPKHPIGLQKLKTYVPPTPPVVSEEMVEKGSSQTATEAPKLAAKREARTPPLPAPIVKRSKS